VKNYRKYGLSPFPVALVHGGPGAAGEMAPVARELSKIVSVLEPFQSANTVDGQIKELAAVLKKLATEPVTLAGFSWGAMLSFLFAASHPQAVKKLLLISCPPLEDKYARDITKTRLERLPDPDREEIKRISSALEVARPEDRDRLMSRMGAILARADSFNPVQDEKPVADCRWDIYDSVWKEAAALRSAGRFLEVADYIKCPAVAIHGDYDPHPAAGVEQPLQNILKDFRFILLPKCGHKPWLEKEAGEDFYRILKSEILDIV
jgi:pimeloyl-ACP methyl ester carboxylesterase